MEAKEIRKKDICEYLSSIGIYPFKETGVGYMYYSPFRPEVVPSLYVRKAVNRWRDFGTDKKGDIIDLVMELSGVEFREALRILSSGAAIDVPEFEKPKKPIKRGIEIVSVNNITHRGLISYLRSRAVEPNLARLYCKQVVFRFPRGKKPGKLHTCIGFPNDSGGWELRNSFLKVSNSPKNVSTLRGNENHNRIYEGFFDFISALTWEKKDRFKETVIVLNSLGYLTTLIPFLRDAQINDLYIDRGNAADAKIVALREAEVPLQDCRDIFAPYDDFNDFLVAKLRGKI